MALDEANHRLFIGCRNPARLLVYDTTTGRVTTSLEIGGDTDDLFYDAELKRFYLAVHHRRTQGAQICVYSVRP
jgi:hypothetical protein